MKHDKLFTMSIHEFNIHLGSIATHFSNAPCWTFFFMYFCITLKSLNFSSRHSFLYSKSVMVHIKFGRLNVITQLFSSNSAFAADLNILFNFYMVDYILCFVLYKYCLAMLISSGFLFVCNVHYDRYWVK